MKKSGWCLVFLMMFFVNYAALAVPGNYYLRIFPENFKEDLRDLNARHYDIAGVDLETQSVDLIVSESDFELLLKEFPMEILAEPGDMSPEKLDPEYKTPQEIETLMAGFAATYPNITSLTSIGLSFENRDIWAIKISDNPMFVEDEPVVLFNGQHHAREVMSSEVSLDTIEYLCSNYGTDPDVTHWVDSLEIWIIPMLNVDGTNYVWTNDNWWRKDRFDNPSSSYYGIDPNRNYPVFWGSCNGSSGNPGDDLYRGQFPRQSVCVDNMLTFEESIMPVLDISYHSYSELVIYPYSCDGDYTPDQAALSTIGQEMAALIERDSGGMGYTPGTCWEILYATDGGDVDTLYANLGTFAYVIELNSSSQGFQPGWSWRDGTVERLRPAWQYILNRVDGPGVAGLVMDACEGTPIVDAVVNIEEIPLTADEQDRTSNQFGRYFRLLNPGSYHLVVSAPGYPETTLPITVGDTRLDYDVNLVPDGAYGLYVGMREILDETGDNDGILDPGETAAIKLFLRSSGLTTNVTADISTTDPYVTIDTGTASFGNIPDGMSMPSFEPHFVVSIDPGCPDEHMVTFDVIMHADQELCINTGSFSEEVTRYVYQCVEETLDTNPGWSGQGQWAWGQPTGQGGDYGSPDPTSGFTGDNVLGYNLNGDYSNNMSSTNYITSGSFDCSEMMDTTFSFYGWVGLEQNQYDEGFIDISTNGGSTWQNIWTNSGTLNGGSWELWEFDVSDIVDGADDVKVRWGIGPTDSGWTYCGWNIDDISFCGDTLPSTTPTPAPTWTPAPPTNTPVPPTDTPYVPPTDTPVPPTNTPTVPTGVPTNTPVPPTTPPTNTPVPPTDTPVQPTHTPTVPTGVPTNTPVPPTTPPTNTPIPSNTPVPPTDTPIPPTDTPIPPTDTPIPPTSTAVPPTSPPDTPTPAPGEFTASLLLNDTMFEGGEQFLLQLDIYNGRTEQLDLQQFLFLDVYGLFFFYPSWSISVDYIDRSIIPGYDELETILDFTWPSGVGGATGLNFWLGFYDPAAQVIVGNIDTVEFGYM
jgi:carboxypeptidase T